MSTQRRFSPLDLFKFNNMYLLHIVRLSSPQSLCDGFPNLCSPFTHLSTRPISSNLDSLTETYNISFYLQYLARWPDLFAVTEHANGTLMGYMMGKAEGNGKNWHGHVTAVTVAPEFRRLGLAQEMMDWLERISEKTYDGYFVDLFVRASNSIAIGMYERLGYTIYRTVIKYYSGATEEDAYDMRKALPRDVAKESVIPLGRPVYPYEL